MTLSAGSRLGPYEVLSPIGAGGMGEVYKARDTRLERTVAVKVLPQRLSSSPEFRQRFEREAKTISQLSHPHICAIHDVGSQDGVDYLVMELLEGETLTERLAKGPLPLDQTLRYAVEIADAMDKAHRQGIVHRDLKPGNIMLTRSGIKLLDFGLAKEFAPFSPQSGLTALPTLAGSPNLTEAGTVLGTFQYMAPEQLEGKEADGRTDIFAFGAVLHEMATGQKAFSGKTQASLIGAILRDEPPYVSSLAPMTPPALDRVVRTCLAKDPEDRFQTAHDVKLQLQWIAEGGSQVGLPAPVVARRRSRERLAWAAAGLAAAAVAVLAYLHFGAPREPLRTVHSSILPPEKSVILFESGPMALSRDGRRIAFVAPTAEGRNLLWVRPLGAGSAQPLAGTEGASYPFWSPDGRFLGFFAGGKLKKIDASGGPPQTLCDATVGRGGSWGPDGTIVFAPSARDPIHRVSAAGGAAAPVTELTGPEPEFSHRFPSLLPDGRHFLYLGQRVLGVRGDQNGIYVGSLDSKERRLLFRGNTNAVYSPSFAGASEGHLLFSRERTLLAQPFDAKRLKLTGEAFPVADHVLFYSTFGFAVFAASDVGMLAFEAGGAGSVSELVWFDRAGKRLDSVGSPADFRGPRISRDDRRVAVDVVDAQTGQTDIWIYDLARRVSTRFTFDPNDDQTPVWSHDDSRIVFYSNRKAVGDLYLKASSGTGADELLMAGEMVLKIPNDWSSDGRFVAFQQVDARTKTGWDLWRLSLSDGKAEPVVRTPASETLARFSPDGRWLAYQSDESGRAEVYVQSFPGRTGKWQISNSGGTQAVWAPDGKELFYIAADNRLMAVEVRGDSSFEAGTPQPLFQTAIKQTLGRRYDVSPDGKRFLVNTVIGEAKFNPITLVQNWAAERQGGGQR